MVDSVSMDRLICTSKSTVSGPSSFDRVTLSWLSLEFSWDADPIELACGSSAPLGHGDVVQYVSRITKRTLAWAEQVLGCY